MLHDSLANPCPTTCQSCHDLVSLCLSHRGAPWDVYLEAPYIPPTGVYNTPAALVAEASKKGEIHAIHGYLLPWFVEKTQYHCVDHRVQYVSGDGWIPRNKLVFTPKVRIQNLLFEYPLAGLSRQARTPEQRQVLGECLEKLYKGGGLNYLVSLLWSSSDLCRDTARYWANELTKLRLAGFDLQELLEALQYPGVLVGSEHVIRYHLSRLPKDWHDYIINYGQEDYNHHQGIDNIWRQWQEHRPIRPNIAAEAGLVDMLILAQMVANFPRGQLSITGFFHAENLAKFFRTLGAIVSKTPKDFNPAFALDHVDAVSRCTILPE